MPEQVHHETHPVEAEDALARGNAVAVEDCDECKAEFDLPGGFAWGVLTGTLFFICPGCWAIQRERAATFLEWIPAEDSGAEAAQS